MDSCDCRSQFFDACWNNSASGNCFAVSGQFVRATGGIKYSKKCGRCGISRIGIYVSCAACQGTYRIQDGGKGAKHHAKNNLFKGDGTRCGRH